jgi:hypothetical protein
MKSKILTTIILATVFLAGCSMLPPTQPIKLIENNEQKISLTTQIIQSLKNGSVITEISNPNLIVPVDINENQIKKYFKIDTILFALVLRNSMNVTLSLPADFAPTFVGILVAEQEDTQWTKFIEVKDTEEINKNNPYYFMVDKQKLLLTIVDQNGTGSGEGIMTVFALSETENWELESCYYFGGSYNDPSVDGDYFAFSTNFSKQKSQPIESCNNVQLVSNE